MMDEPILVVAEAGDDGPDVDARQSVRLTFRFESGLDGARRLERSTDPVTLHQSWGIPSRWRPLAADFRQQVLNTPFADLLMRVRPRTIRVEKLVGCTLDLPRISALWRIPVTVVLPPVNRLPPPASREARWLKSSLEAATALEFPSQESDPQPYRAYTDAPIHAFQKAPRQPASDRAAGRFDYALYEFCTRDHALLWHMQEAYVGFFEGCKDVLDLGCGAGVFMGMLERTGIAVTGVERNSAIAGYARGLGFDVTEADALEFLDRQSAAFDGIYCSHFVEHLPTDKVNRLLGLMFRAIRPGGRVVLVFPDPESIRSQLLGFWRDPEHVRFYHPDLVELMARSEGFDCVWHSHRDGPATREVVPFPAQPAMDAVEWPQPVGGLLAGCDSWPEAPRSWSRWLARLGMASGSSLRRLEKRQAETEARLQRLAEAFSQTQQALALLRSDTRRLWQVNQTWAWEDNAVLVLRR